MPRNLLKPSDLETAFEDVRKVFTRGPELDCAILGAAYVEKWLGALLRHLMIPKESFIKQLFGSGGVLENSGAQNDIAYSVEFISAETHRNIGFINRIRNEFAHSHRTIGFADDPITNLCNELTFYHSTAKAAKAFRRKNATTPRRAFCMCVAVTGTCLMATARWTTHSPRGRFLDDAMERILNSIDLQISGLDTH